MRPGDYFEQVAGHGNMHIPWYDKPPDDPESGVGTNGKKRSLEVCYGARPGTIFGPIEEVRDNWCTKGNGFISARVKTVKKLERLHDNARVSRNDLRHMQDFIWINLGKNPDPMIYADATGNAPSHLAVWCRRLSDTEKEAWRHQLRRLR